VASSHAATKASQRGADRTSIASIVSGSVNVAGAIGGPSQLLTVGVAATKAAQTHGKDQDRALEDILVKCRRPKDR
jgi:hypothetical protein